MTQHYFTMTGDWGLREYLDEETLDWMVVPTGTWTREMFDLLDDLEASKRWDMAKHFNVNVHRIFYGKCQVCKLSTSQLEGQWLVDKTEEVYE